MSEDQQSLEWRLKLLSAAPSWQYSQQDIDKLRAENSELRKLVKESWIDCLLTDLTFEQWSAQHPILQHDS